VPEGGGVYVANLQILVHQGACAARLRMAERVYDRSPRGRWRSAWAVRAWLDAARAVDEALSGVAW
jgi:hypothetical protein